MKKMSLMAILILIGAVLNAHPHFRKTLTIQLPAGVEATLTYQTVPANQAHADNAAMGEFITPRRPTLTLSADLQAGSVLLPAGEYTVGVIKKADNDWTMALYPGAIGRGETPDATKVIRLDSLFSADRGEAEHLVLDIQPGTGGFEGKVVLSIHFGSLSLDGVLS